jgi:molybdopterin-guanine dinucleotide biosynthesis protein A
MITLARIARDANVSHDIVMNCYILVGGRSRRMGTSKVALFLDRIVAAARPLFDEVLAVHRPDGEPVPIRTIFELPHEGEGPLHGIARALADAPGRCVIVAVDYPAITSELLAYLVERGSRSKAPAVVPVWHGHPQVLCAVYDPALLPLVEARIAAEEYDVRGLIAAAGAEMIGEDELRSRFPGEPLFNVNTPEELREAEKLDG